MGDYLGFLPRIVRATVSIETRISEANPSVHILGKERMGTGAVVRPDGHILTVNYIVLGAKEISVSLYDRRQFPARIVHQDYETGLAIIRIPCTRLPTVPLGDSDDLSKGQKTLIVASLSKHERRATQGFITALRRFDAYWEYMLARGIFTTAVNPGFGGGLLLTNRGLMVGTVSLNLNTLREMTLAIPINHYHQIREEALVARPTRRPPRPWLGVYTEDTDNRVTVVQTVPRGPAHRSNLQAKDVIVEVNGRGVSTRCEFYEEMWKCAAGDELTLTLLRGEDFTIVRTPTMDRAEFYGTV
jgi:S1-C subfamily serine protease